MTPGLFSPVGAIGLSEVGAVAGTNDATQRGNQFAAGFDVAGACNPRSIVVAISRVDGVTQAGLTPRTGGGTDDQENASHVLSGLGSVVHLGGDSDSFMQRGGVVVANFGESGSKFAGDPETCSGLFPNNVIAMYCKVRYISVTFATHRDHGPHQDRNPESENRPRH